jgi:hypothetical protein
MGRPTARTVRRGRWADPRHCPFTERSDAREGDSRGMVPGPNYRSSTAGNDRRPMIGESTDNEAEHDRLFELILRLSSRIDQPTLLEDILCSVGSFWHTGSGALLLGEGPEGRPRVATSIGIPAGHEEILEGAAGSALLAAVLVDGQPKSVDGLRRLAVNRRLADAVVPQDATSACFLPLLTPSGIPVGVIALYFEDARGITAKDRQHYTVLGPLLAQYIFTARTHAMVKRAASRFRARAKKLNGVAQACAGLATLSDRRAILRHALDLATTWIPLEGCAIDLFRGDGRILETEGACRTADHRCGGTCSTPSIAIRRSLVAQLARSRAPVVIRGVNAAQLEIPRALGGGNPWDERVPTSVLCLPLIASGEMVGCLTLVRTETNRHDPEEDLLLASEIARHTALALLGLQKLRAPAVLH